MIAKKLAQSITLAATMIALAAAFAVVLSGCSVLEDDDSSMPAEGSAAASYGLPRLPAAQGIIEFSSERAVEVLSNFEYREHDGEGQWSSGTQDFEMFDEAQSESEANTSNEAGWVMVLSTYDGAEWHNCTLEDLKAGADPERATITVFSSKDLSFEDLQDAANFIDALTSSARGVFALEMGDAGGSIPCAVTKNTTGAVREITQDAPNMFTVHIHSKSDWVDGSYDDTVAECKKYAENEGCSCGEFAKVAPLFEDPYLDVTEL